MECGALEGTCHIASTPALPREAEYCGLDVCAVAEAERAATADAIIAVTKRRWKRSACSI